MQYEEGFSDLTFFSMNNLTKIPFYKPDGKSSADGEKLVLILSRDDDTRFLYRTLLEMWNYRVTESTNVEETLSTVAVVKTDIILFDCVMPFSLNLETLGKLRESDGLAEMPIVLISGFAQPHYRSLALGGGADDYLVKPVDFDMLEDSLQNNISKNNSKNRQARNSL